MSVVAAPLIAILIILGDPRPQIALSHAIWRGDTRSAQLSLWLGARMDTHPGGSLPNVVLAGGQGNVEMIEFLLTHGADIRTQDKFGGTALLRAAQNGQSRAVEYLLDHGADPNTKDKEGGHTAMDYALRSNERLVRLLTLSVAKVSEP